MDYILFCQKYFKATGIPISLLKESVIVYSSLGELLNYSPTTSIPLTPQDRNPDFMHLTPDLEYGSVLIEDTNYAIIVGPIFSVPVTEELVRLFIREQRLPLQYKEQLTELFYSMPVTSHTSLLNQLSLIHLCVNGKDTDYFDIAGTAQKQNYSRNIDYMHQRIEHFEHAQLHNAYTFELGLYECVREGNVKKLTNYLNSITTPPWEGKLAFSPLRHAKNIFISAVQKTGLIGAIPGGLEIEKTYQLMDYYILECEKLHDINAISNLLSAMLFDFCRRCGETRIPDGISSDIFICMSYIRTHTNESITLDDVAAQINRSTSYVMKKFKEELGIHAGSYISRCKLEEAKSMLIYTEKSLAEISSYLCFSSQSYFQNVFKKQYGVTPMQYRKNGQRVLH